MKVTFLNFVILKDHDIGLVGILNLQVALLIDSLYQNFTISNILIWKGQDELARRRVGGSIQEIKIPQNMNTENIIYLLDGQQRTTALTYAFTDKVIYKAMKKKTNETYKYLLG